MKSNEKGLPIKFILVVVDYDEGLTDRHEYSTIEEVKEYFHNDEGSYGNLFETGEHDWEWGHFQLIDLGDYQ